MKRTIPIILITALVTSIGTALGAVIVNKWSPWLFSYLNGDSILIIRVVGNQQPINGVKFALVKPPYTAKPVSAGTTDSDGYAFFTPGTGQFIVRAILCKEQTDQGLEYSKPLYIEKLPQTMTLEVQNDFKQPKESVCLPPSSPQTTEIRKPEVTNKKGYLVARLDEQSTSYIDRGSYVYTNIPSALQGQSYIITANGDKCPESPAAFSLHFDVTQPSTVFIAHDDRYATKPSWMASFAKTDQSITLTVPGGNFKYTLYRKDFSPGTIMLGSNIDSTCQQEGDFGMYSVIVAPQGVQVRAAP
jgi:hypothetical protein